MSRRELQPITFIVSGVLALVFVCGITVLQNCSSSTGMGTGSTVSPATQSALEIVSIQALSGEGCLQLAKRHPEQVTAGMSDLSAAQEALNAGAMTYGDILALALNHVRIDPQAMVIVGPVITAIEAVLGPNGKTVIPVKGSLQAQAIQAGITGCQTGLMAAGK